VPPQPDPSVVVRIGARQCRREAQTLTGARLQAASSLGQEAIERLHDDGAHGPGLVGVDRGSSPRLMRRPAVRRARTRSPEPVDDGANLDPCLAGCATNLDADQLGVAVVAAMANPRSARAWRTRSMSVTRLEDVADVDGCGSACLSGTGSRSAEAAVACPRRCLPRRRG
jgi:hypothetical protein